MLAFLICLIASTVGAIAGFGGGVIIKPVFDLLGLMPVATVSFMSSCTVLAMSVSSLLRTRKSPVKLDLHTSTPLAIGAAVGGLVGKWLFELVRQGFPSQNTLGSLQSACLTLTNIFVFIYICKKAALPSLRVKNAPATLLIGMALGIISSFLGIGGGPINVAALFFFFSMDAKTAARNSIYVIMFSQTASLISSIAGGNVPNFAWSDLLLMVSGGVGGALLGAAISHLINTRCVEILLRILILVVSCISLYNTIRFAFLV